MYKEIEFENWNDLKSYLTTYNSNWIFRGQEDYSWRLQSSIDRVSFKNEIANQKKHFEEFYIRDIKRNPHLYADKFNVNSDFQVLSLLQHYGIPTRLVDFSASPYVAAFFAVINSETDSSIFAIDYFQLLNCTGILFGTKYKDEDCVHIKNFMAGGGMSDDDIFKGIILKKEQRKFIEVVQPFFLFDRMIQQNGIFLCQGDINCDFEENLSMNHSVLNKVPNAHQYFKLKIKAAWKDEIVRDLRKMNITSASLFPGIEGYLKSLKNTFDIYMADRGDSLVE